MVKAGVIFIVGAILVGAAVAGTLFMLYPDMMFGQSSLSSQTEGGTSGLGSPQDTTTASDSSVSGSNSTNTTAGTPYGTTP